MGDTVEEVTDADQKALCRYVKNTEDDYWNKDSVLETEMDKHIFPLDELVDVSQMWSNY
jgi:hypothetical protein